MIVHSDQAEATQKNDKIEQASQHADTETDKFFLHPRFMEGLSDPSAGPKDYFKKQNPCGFMVRLTKMAV